MNDHDQESTSSAPSTGTALLLRPVESVAFAVRRVPGVGTVSGMVDGVLDTVGLVSPRARRIAAYTGAGLLGALGAVEWPVAAAGAAAVWLTQARPVGAAGAAPSPARAGGPAGKTGPTGPTGPTEPTEPTEPAVPAVPAESAEPDRTVEPSKPKAPSAGSTPAAVPMSKASRPGAKAPSRPGTSAGSAGSSRRKPADAADRG
ncbi:hypothetical protein [Kitasatospora sp. NPDC017646]|uniref:hypothetical protein n=1 Tax=Kitasatospora sp. NPDC017646 TaxID=3364024 RepID=UPI00379D4F03